MRDETTGGTLFLAAVSLPLGAADGEAVDWGLLPAAETAGALLCGCCGLADAAVVDVFRIPLWAAAWTLVVLDFLRFILNLKSPVLGHRTQQSYAAKRVISMD